VKVQGAQLLKGAGAKWRRWRQQQRRRRRCRRRYKGRSPARVAGILRCRGGRGAGAGMLLTFHCVCVRVRVCVFFFNAFRVFSLRVCPLLYFDGRNKNLSLRAKQAIKMTAACNFTCVVCVLFFLNVSACAFNQNTHTATNVQKVTLLPCCSHTHALHVVSRTRRATRTTPQRKSPPPASTMRDEPINSTPPPPFHACLAFGPLPSRALND